MSELERRLRAALHAASEQPPPGLMEAVLRRHRRHRIRVGASLVAVVAAVAVAVPPLAGALRGTQRVPVAMRPVPAQGSHGVRPHAAPGTVLSGCAGANPGAVGVLKPAGPAVLPLRFMPGGHSSGHIRLYVAIVVLRHVPPGAVVVVRVPAAHSSDLRFLYGPADGLEPGTRYTMHSGEAGVTFEACRTQPSAKGPLTDYYGGYLVRGRRCVPVRVWVPSTRQHGTVRLGACPGR